VTTLAHLQGIALFGGPPPAENVATAPASPDKAKAAPGAEPAPLPVGVRAASNLAASNASPDSTIVAKEPSEAGNGAPAGDAARGSNDWVEITSAVNMRGGPSSANPVIKVQRAGAKLRVLERDGGWVHVAEPETGQTGWIYERYVSAAAVPALAAETTAAAVR
jgi:uncharacterized protein YgiM (DUF1202 family)